MIDTSLHRTKGRIAGATQSNKFTADPIFLVSEFQAKKGGRVEVLKWAS
jgi:hypothetical protein